MFITDWPREEAIGYQLQVQVMYNITQTQLMEQGLHFF